MTKANPRERSCAVCLHNGRLLAIELQDPASGDQFWSLPGGLIEPGETPQAAAVRETLEETGYRVRLTGDSYSNEYLFHWNAARFQCKTHWFSAALVTPDPVTVNDAAYILQAKWLAWPGQRYRFDYHPAIAQAVRQLLP